MKMLASAAAERRPSFVKTLTLVVDGVELSPAEAMRRMNEAASHAADEMRDEVEDDDDEGYVTVYQTKGASE